MRNDLEAELKRVEAKSKSERKPPKRQPDLTGGERAETAAERAARKRRRAQPRRPPIVERTP